MTVKRRPVPNAVLPYPQSPASQNGSDAAERFPSIEELERLPESHSTSNVSDLSDGWVDGGMGPKLQPPNQDLPQSLKIGQHSNHSHVSSLASETGFENIERPDTNHSNSNNPFRARSTERHKAPESDIWKEITDAPPHESSVPSSSLPDVGRLAVDTSKIAVNEPSGSADEQVRQSFELPASPVGKGKQPERPDIWAELDAALNPPNDRFDNAPIPVEALQPTQKPPSPFSQPTDNIEPLPVPLPQSTSQTYDPPPGPPPGHSTTQTEPPSSLPQEPTEIYEPPPSLPPRSNQAKQSVPWPQEPTETYEPPPGPPPQRDPRSAAQVQGSSQKLLPLPPQSTSASTSDPKQRNETYQIKQISWLDESTGTTRTTPIMIQNANGPCPLLALVNALTLSTPATTTTALVETLRTREQVSLGLLLDAVFDELMSDRRGGAVQELPDMSELYAFLLTLHTGMNVNPRFVPPAQSTLIDGLDEVEDLRKPGGFEDTREMKLYGTFAIPLVHGWLAPKRHPAYEALKRSANTYEDAQNLMFHEEELEDKLRQHGLTTEEQQLLQDISLIKSFLASSATQLTGYGLDIVADTLSPGAVAILFRNDHFSTLYKHPRSGQLLGLVTDFGYATHEEVVWESLVDVSGEACEFYSGDFRPVGTQDTAPRPPRPRIDTQSATQPTTEEPLSPFEQEDADLALAMQLQEEEEESQRRATQQRQDEEQASQAYISGYNTVTRGGAQNRGRGSRRTSQPQRPHQPSVATPVTPTPRRESTPPAPVPILPQRPTDPEAGIEAPPPSYEQAAKLAPYTGPVPEPGSSSVAGPSVGRTGLTSPSSNSPSYAQMRASNGVPSDPYTRPRGASAYSQNRAMSGTSPPSPEAARRRASGAAALEPLGLQRRSTAELRRERERDKDCTVM